MLLKVLGAIDLISAFIFLMLIFGMNPGAFALLACAGLLFLKGGFIFTGDVLSAIDLVSALVLVLSVFFTFGAFILWFPCFLLLAKGFVSFI